MKEFKMGMGLSIGVGLGCIVLNAILAPRLNAEEPSTGIVDMQMSDTAAASADPPTPDETEPAADEPSQKDTSVVEGEATETSPVEDGAPTSANEDELAKAEKPSSPADQEEPTEAPSKAEPETADEAPPVEAAQPKPKLPMIAFAVGSFDLNPEEKASLKPVADALEANKKLGLFVMGHADRAGSFKQNVWLSKRRARSVKNALVAMGINKNRIRISGLGESEASDGAQSKDRRVELFWQ